MAIFICLALIPITVSIQLPNAVATRSVGEKASPKPLLSRGASVAMVVPDRLCTAVVCSDPVYVIVAVMNIDLKTKINGVLILH